ncbi:MAG: BREX-1 system adenine-specific DNA-methyltransferase PglX [Bacteroidetes bacterium]|nr:BREX-1 system adenine-specific DNA-methyltransferase PglX [Bacteroidota bacterium]
MNTNRLKKFAQAARRKLMEQVEARLEFVLTTDSVELREKTDQLKALREELNKTTREQLVEKVAYTWFNRLMALRFMDANDYQPLGIHIVSPKDGYTLPEILDEAKQGNIPGELKINRQKVFDLLDSRLSSSNPQNEAYKELLIATCNHLHRVFPFMFEHINDYTELLLPDDLTSEFSVVFDIREGMSTEDCRQVEIIGWLYQFYISEEKDKLINAKKRYKAHEIAPVTQLFTPDWIVRYMVDNTLGQYWKEARLNTKITNELEFYIKPIEESKLPKRQITSPEEITFFDPCVGSGHILCYAFDIFYKIYEEEGYNSSDIPELIITKNLYGIDIDDRAAQLAGFALMMKGRKYYRRFLKKNVQPNITAFQNIESDPRFLNAKIHGSLIQVEPSDIEKIRIDDTSLFTPRQKQHLLQASLLVRKYDLCVTNPPYMNSSYMEGTLKQFIEKNYPETKSDLFACLLMQVTQLTKPDGLIGFICPFVWMFIKSYEKLRSNIITNSTISSLIQLEYNAFEPACVPVCTFTLRNEYVEDYRGSYIKLSDFTGSENQPVKTLEAIQNPNCSWFYTANQKDFEKIPGCPIAYWVSKKTIGIFNKSQKLERYGDPRQGMATSDNKRFLRVWHEVKNNKKGLSYKNRKEASLSNKKWFPYNKGGAFRKWYGHQTYLVNWGNDGNEILEYASNLYGSPTRTIKSISEYFKTCLSWSKISNSAFSLRYFPNGFLFDVAGCCIFCQEESDMLQLLGILNSKPSNIILEILSPTLNYEAGTIREYPIIKDNYCLPEISIKDNVKISKSDWDCHETSWDFQLNELINNKTTENIEYAYESYEQYWKNKFFQLHKNEEELNKIFIEIYGLEEEFTPDVELKDITILQNELNRNELKNIKLQRNAETGLVASYEGIELPFNKSEVMHQFVSYAVGCMFGRYSLDKESLILANQGEILIDFVNKVKSKKIKEKSDISFMPDEDNIIPVLDDEWFEDDIAGRFNKFLKVTFGEQNFEKNLAFVEECLGKNIRKYSAKDFYNDHIRRYKKRPIYWMFSSPQGTFNALIYMHRYTPDTVSNILNGYLREYQEKLRTRKEFLIQVQSSTSTSAAEKNKAMKEQDKIEKQLMELQKYEREILYPLATDRVEIDLDDGVLVNYNKFGKAVKQVTGINDPKTKEKVKEFDWIDTSTIK